MRLFDTLDVSFNSMSIMSMKEKLIYQLIKQIVEALKIPWYAAVKSFTKAPFVFRLAYLFRHRL